ncbi:MAG: FKBP-type peptidyl-prolyl cis-trans isomerase [Fimbriimonadaceae bacterium]|nr:FKBP-type peptidyl-prolyl cis-trans isomerase [Fimbriimonadaceae bacterium]
MSRTIYVGLTVALSLFFVGCKDEKANGPLVLEEGELKITDIKVGEGDPIENGDGILVMYTGKLKDGKQFDSNEDKDDKGGFIKLPLGFFVGSKELIEGWDKGVLGMKKGGVRELVIPPNLGYGLAGFPPDVKPNATLYFTVTVVDVVKPGKSKEMSIEDIKVGTGREVKEGDKVEISYLSRLANGFEYENSNDYDDEMIFTIGEDRISTSISVGMVGMKVGGTRKMRMPYGLWSGMNQKVYLAPPQVLYYEVTLKKIF